MFVNIILLYVHCPAPGLPLAKRERERVREVKSWESNEKKIFLRMMINRWKKNEVLSIWFNYCCSCRCRHDNNTEKKKIKKNGKNNIQERIRRYFYFSLLCLHSLSWAYEHRYIHTIQNHSFKCIWFNNHNFAAVGYDFILTVKP